MLDKLVLFILWLFIVYSLFYVIVISYKRYIVYKYFNSNFKTIPAFQNRLSRLKIATLVIWSILGIASIMVYDAESTFPIYLLPILSVFMIMTVLLGRGGFDYRNANSKLLFFNESGIIFFPANKNSVFSYKYSLYTEIESIIFEQNEIYPAYYDGKMLFRSGSDVEFMIHSDDKILYEAVLGKYIKNK